MGLDELRALAFRGTLMAGMLSIAACSEAPKYRLRDGEMYPYGPDKAEVHTLSRLRSDGSGIVHGAVVFIEFRDLDGETCRGVGDVELALVVSGREPQPRRLKLDNTGENIALWNRAVRMYEVPFTIDPPLTADSPTAVRADLKWMCGTKPVVTDSVQLTAATAQ